MEKEPFQFLEADQIEARGLTPKTEDQLRQRLALARTIKPGQQILFESRGKLCMGKVTQVDRDDDNEPLFAISEAEGRPLPPTYVHWYEVSSPFFPEKRVKLEVGEFVIWRDEDQGRVRRGQVRAMQHIGSSDGPAGTPPRLTFTIIPCTQDGSLEGDNPKQVPDYRILGLTLPPVAVYNPLTATKSRARP